VRIVAVNVYLSIMEKEFAQIAYHILKMEIISGCLGINYRNTK
jgi:hypothetical protein